MKHMDKSETRYVIDTENQGHELSLTPRQVYEVLPDPAEVNGMIRIIDDWGEDYLFEAELFEPVQNLTELTTEITIGLT